SGRSQSAIIRDQTAAGDERLRATILFRRQYRYEYRNNAWLTGIQYFTVMPDPAFPTGAAPVLCCIHNGKNPYDNGPLAIGWLARWTTKTPPRDEKLLSSHQLGRCR